MGEYFSELFLNFGTDSLESQPQNADLISVIYFRLSKENTCIYFLLVPGQGNRNF